MTPSRVVRVLIAILLLTAIPSIAAAATTEFRVLFDVDNDAGTGCTVNGMDGVEQVLVTQVTEGDPMRVTRTHRQICMGVVLGSPTDIVTDGWDAGWNPTNKLLTIETRIPFTAFGSAEMPSDIHAGFDGTRSPVIHTALVNADGTAIMIPPPPVRRRAIGVGPVRHITMDGNLADWGDIKPIVFGLASNGTDTLRLLRILAWPDPNDNHLYFAATAYLGSDHPWADDDVYLREPGESLSIGAPGVLDNDGIPGNAPLSAEKVSDPSRGTVTLNADGSFTYSPTHPQLLSSDEFEYKARAAGKESNVARVIIQINQNEFPPCPGQEHPNAPCPDAYSTLEDTTLVEPAPGVLENDPHGDKLNASLFEAPDHGTVVINADGGFTYTPDDDFFGIDTFIYTATKKVGAPPGIGGNATVTITVTNVNDEPSFTPGPSPVTTTASSGPYSAVWATNISAGPDESDQSVNFVVSNDNTALFSVQPAISPNGTLTFTPAGFQGSATVSVRLEDNGGTANGGDDSSPTVFFTIIISCGTITVTNPATNTATAGVFFSQNFTQSGAVGGATFTTSSTLPAGLTLATNGTLSGTPTQPGSFPIVVTVTDGTGCMASGPTYNLVVSCQTITVTNPANANGTASSPFSETFTQAGGNGVTTFSLASGTLPAGLTLAANGVLSGTPTQTGSFPITVMATDANGCTGTGATYNLVIGCQTITVTNPANGNGTAASPFSETFTQTGGIGTTTFSLASGTLPAGLTLAANGVLSGTPTQTGSFPITVTATDSNGCTGTGTTYTIIIGCQTITVTNPANANGTVSSPFSETFTQTGAIGTATFTTASTLPAGLSLSTAGVLSGTPTEDGTFPIVVTVTDSNGCTGTSATYNLVIGCQTITVTNPVNTGGTVSAGFSETFTQTAAVGGATFTLNSGVLPAGLTLATNGTLSGTPTEDGSFPITVLVTDGNGCTGVSATYNLVIACQTITVTNPANATGAAGSPFSETFTQTGAVGGATFTLASGTLPAGLTLSTAGVLSGTPTEDGSFPITVLVTDGNGCTGVSATYPLNITCPTITVTNPANDVGTSGVAFSETFTQTGGVGTITWSFTGVLPAGITLNPSTGVLSGTTNDAGTFPITVTATDQNGCDATGALYNLTINCQTITVTNPGVNTGTVDAAFSETFTQTGVLGTVTWSVIGTLPAGITLNPSTGVLSGTPTEDGVFAVTVRATDTNGCFDDSPYTLTINCQTITVTNPGVNTGTVDSPFSQQFTESGAHATATFTTSSTLPAGLSLDSSTGILSGTPTEDGVFNIVVMVTDANGCTGTGATYTLTINCQTITVTNPANTNGTVSSPFSETFTQTGAHLTATFTTASTLPAGLSLSTAGVLSGTPTEDGVFPIVVTVTDANGCTGTSATYNLTIGCQTITVTNPVNTGGTVSAGFSETFTQTAAVGGATFTLNSGVLPAGLTLATNGTLSGTPTEDGSFPITVLVTDGNGCTGVSATYNLVIACQTITVTNPANATGPAGSPFSETFTQTGAVGGATFTTASTLPTGLSLSTAGVLSGTPTQGGTFPIVVTVTDGNGCTGTGATYNLIITCPVITVTNPANTSGTAGTAFSETFTQSGGQGTVTFTTSSTLPTGLSLSTAGVLSGTPTQTGNFSIVVTVTDQNGCVGTGATYNLVIACQTITVNNPANANGTAGSPFSETFTAPAAIGGATFTLATGTLPAGLSLATNGTLSGTPTQTGSFPITVLVTDGNGCTGTSATYNLFIACQVITVNNPANANGTVNAAFSETFTQTGAIGSASFTTASTLPAGLTLSTAGVLSGTPTEDGSFPIVVTVTDANGCTGTSATYNLVIACQTITVTNPANANGTVGSVFSETFTQSGSIGTATFTTASTLPAGLSLSTAGVLSGTPTQAGNFPIVVTVTDSNGCTGTSATYNLVIVCQTITVTNPANANGTVDAAFSETFTQTGAIGTATFTTASTLPSGLTLSTAGVLSGTPGEDGTFPIVVTVTDSNGCTGTSATYNLVIACQTITVTNPAVTNGTVDAAFSQTFTQAGVGTHTPVTWSFTGTLPSGLTLDTSTGVLSGTPGQPGNFPIVVTVTDVNGCSGTGATYNLVIACQVITVTNPGVTSATYNAPFSQTFTQTGVGTHTPATFTTSSTLPAGLSLSTAGVLSGTPTQTGTFPIVVTVTDVNGCTGTGATYTLSVAPVANPDAYNNAVNNTQFVLTGGTTATPSTPSVQVAGTIVTNDLPAGSVSVVPGTSATANGGSVTVAADGTFLYTPPAQPGVPPSASDTFTYTVTSNTGGTGPVTSAPATVTINLVNRVWYVKNDSAAGGDGRSHQPFDTLAEAQTASTANDYIYVYFGNGTTSGQNSGFVMKNNQKLYGQGIALVVNAQTLVGAGSQPLIGNSGGIGVSATNLTGIEIRGLNIAGSTDAVAVILNVASTVTTLISNNTISGAGNEGIDVDASAGSMSIAVNDNTLTATGNAIDIAETAAGAITITAFDDNVISGNTGGAGIAVTGATFDTTPGAPFNLVTGGATAVGASGNGVGTSGVVLTNVAGDLSFTNLNIYNSAGTGLFVTSTGVFNAGTGVGFRLVANSGTDTIQSAGGPAVNISTSTINLTPSVVTSTGTTTFGVNLDTVAGTFTAASGSSISGVASAAATAYRINNSSVNATYNGTINITQGAGVSLTTNTGTYAFTGQLTLSTGAANGFVATSSGTVSTNNTSSTLVTTTGTALNVSNTNIALAGLRFVSITAGTAASGPASGIILNNTGTTAAFGGLTIGGGASAGNGGTIQRCATGISLTSTRDVVLNDVNMSNFTDWAIRGTTVVNFNADNLQVTGTNGDNDATDDGSIRFTGLTGSATISNSSVSGGHEDNIVVLNSSGVLNRITISNTNIGANGTTFGDNGILFETSGTATLNATVTGCTFTSTRGDHVQFNAATGSPNGDFVLTSNNFSNSHPSTVSGAGGIRVVTGAAGSTPNLTYNITGNTINGARGTAIGTTEGAGTGNLSGTISGNFIGTAATANSGSSEGGGISVVVADFGSHTVNITGNTIRQYHQFGIFVQAGGGAVVSSGDLKAVVTGNSVSTPGPTAYGPGKNGFHLNSGTMVGDTFRVCLDFGGAGVLENSIVGSGDNLGGNGTDFRLRHRQSTTVYLNGYGGANNNDAAVIAYIQGRNAGSPTGTVTNNIPNGGGWSTAFCPF